MNTDKRLSLRIKILTILTTLSVLLVFFTAYTKYIHAKDYYFFVEAPCDETSQTCFVRDCDEYCPPNELEIYKVFLIKAKDFNTCTENSCANICENTATEDFCEEIMCDVENGDDCTP